jgi:uncharacterized protein (DUF302 family)
MAYETKVILVLLAQQIGKAKSLKEAYNAVMEAANVEGVKIPTYDEYKEKLKEQE